MPPSCFSHSVQLSRRVDILSKLELIRPRLELKKPQAAVITSGNCKRKGNKNEHPELWKNEGDAIVSRRSATLCNPREVRRLRERSGDCEVSSDPTRKMMTGC